MRMHPKRIRLAVACACGLAVVGTAFAALPGHQPSSKFTPFLGRGTLVDVTTVQTPPPLDSAVRVPIRPPFRPPIRSPFTP
jgi:hypothetical protein